MVLDVLTGAAKESAMLGWYIVVYPEGSSGKVDDPRTVAHWPSPMDGRDWLDEMVKMGRAELLGENGGYPVAYRALWGALMPALFACPEVYRGPVVVDENHGILPGWYTTKNFNRAAFVRCKLRDRMLIQCWDRS